MKKILFSISLLFCLSSFAFAIEGGKRYTLYQTDNMYTFLKLDTRTGAIWQVHWSTDGIGRAIVPLSTKVLSSDTTNGRFALFPTKNMYNFILLDTIDGSTYQVQWSWEKENRILLKINYLDVNDDLSLSKFAL